MGRMISMSEIAGQLVDERDGRYYRIDGVERMEPFLMSVVSDSDLWMWISSAGGLTAGRRNADHALFPYLTDDYLHRAAGRSGPITVVARMIAGRREVWQPYALQPSTTVTRAVAKHLLGHRVMLEEYHYEWGLLFRTSWSPSRDYGWVRESEIVNLSGGAMEVELLDGLLDVMPTGVPALTEQSFSNLANAYKRTEIGRWGTAAVFSMEALISDRAQPAEALAATVVWSSGHDFDAIHLDERVVVSMVRGGLVAVAPIPLLVGRPGAYLLHDQALTLAAGARREWMIVCDIDIDHRAFATRFATDGDGTIDADAVHRSVDGGAKRLSALLAAADGFQQSGDEIADAHHLSNVLFNSMRGGVFPRDYQVLVADFARFVGERNSECYTDHRTAIAALGGSVERDALLAMALRQGDHCLVRIVCEYLPLTFSRRHGDPSRPWNRFEIEVEDRAGNELLSFQGNWRDIFQNWEALLYSFPHFIPHVVAKFVNASTIDGHNPYRLVRNGFEWEAPNPNNPWSNIGYWGDHQIVYLFRLLKAWQRFDPHGMREWLNRSAFTYADTPYVLVDYQTMVDTPRNTIVYDDARAQQMQERVRRIGSDGQLVVDGAGNIIHVSLMEKLLVPALAKMSAFVPRGGIWMNTQRPEWNDANNALAGFGLSMVTLYYLRQYLSCIRSMISEDGGAARSFTISAAVAEWLQRQSAALQRHAALASRPQLKGTAQRAFVDELGGIASDYRRRARERFDGAATAVAAEQLDAWCAIALRHLDGSIAAARRPDDGLFHSYNLIRFVGNSAVEVSHLDPMLEGQVAVLAAEVLDSTEVLALVDALYASPLYRENQQSFILYPARVPPAFCDRNSLPASMLADFPALRGAEKVLQAVLSIDSVEQLHFLPEMTNALAVERVLDQTSATNAQRAAVLEIYEWAFNHHAYSGRSGSMYSYEGIGSIYWHMIGKLQLAVQECYWAARERGEPAETVAQLADAYRRVRAGLGFCKSPKLFGAIPTDCYSHTPSHAGAQQPGMTGQVKEGILARIGELGIRVTDGRISLMPGLTPPDELFRVDDEDEASDTAGTADGGGAAGTADGSNGGALDTADGGGDTAGSGGVAARFSFCAVPFEIVPIAGDTSGGGERGEIEWRDGRREPTATGGLSLTATESRQVFGRSKEIACIRFFIS